VVPGVREPSPRIKLGGPERFPTSARWRPTLFSRSLSGGSTMTMSALGEPCVLLKLGEIVLKGKNRELFERRLIGNIRRALTDLDIKVDVRRRHGVIAVFLPSGATAEQAQAVAERIADVPGLVWIHPAWRVAKDPDTVLKAGLALFAERDEVRRKASFAVRSRRRDKRFPLRSNELDRLV